VQLFNEKSDEPTDRAALEMLLNAAKNKISVVMRVLFIIVILSSLGSVSATPPILLNDLNTASKRNVPGDFFGRIFRISVVPGCVRVFGSGHT